MRTFVLMGPPGAGKGTQARFLSPALSARVISSGAEVRRAAGDPSILGRKIKEITERGDLVPHWFISHLFVDLLASLSAEDAVILDGFCRKEEEAKLFEEVCAFLERDYRVVYIAIPEAEMRARLAKRLADEGRKDDSAESLARRMEEFSLHTLPALAHFREKGRVIEIDGMGTPEEIAMGIERVLTPLL